MPDVVHYLGIDYGTKHVGVAVGQALTQTASPLTTLHWQHRTFWKDFTTLVQEWHPTALIVGLAQHPDGSDAWITEKTRQFGRHLSRRYRLPVHYIDEHLTSAEAQRMLRDGNFALTYRDKNAIAAAIILESWLHSTAREQK